MSNLHGLDEEQQALMDPTKIGHYSEINAYSNDAFRSLSAGLRQRKKREVELTDKFKNSLNIKLNHNEVKLYNIHAYGGPGTGKSTLARTIGYLIWQNYGDDFQGLEGNYLPDFMHYIDTTKQILFLSVDDPMGAAEEGGSQDARKGMSADVELARSTFNAIRHKYIKRVLTKRAEKKYNGLVPDEVTDAIEKYHDNRVKLKPYLGQDAFVTAIIYVVWGPQLPTIDQTFHTGKSWNIYKGLGAMDEPRRKQLISRLGKEWTQKLGKKEEEWRIKDRIEARSWAVLENAFTYEKGWLHLPPPKDGNGRIINILKPIPKGSKGYQEMVKLNTMRMDTWAAYIYDNRNSLMPPYDPFGKQGDRHRALKNFIRDVLSRNKDPRTFEELTPQDQRFFKDVNKGKVAILDDRIIKHHHEVSDEMEQITGIAQQLMFLMEKADFTPWTRGAQAMANDLARREISTHQQFIDIPRNFKKVFDHVQFLWFETHPEDTGRKDMTRKSKKVSPEAEEKLVEDATKERLDENIVEFAITEEQIINSILKENPELNDWALIYMHTEGICGRDILSNRQMFNITQDEKQRKKFGFKEQMKSEEAVKYRKQQFRGRMSYVLGKVFEDWLEEMLIKGCYIPKFLENVKTIKHADYSKKGYPDLVARHEDGSYSIIAAKCYASSRSETLEKAEITPEIAKHNNLLQKNKKSKILVIYANIKIPHMMVVKEFRYASDVPTNLTFSPSMAGKTFFRRP